MCVFILYSPSCRAPPYCSVPRQVTEDTAELLKNTFKVEERGLVYVKGKGELRTFFVGEEWREQSL